MNLDNLNKWLTLVSNVAVLGGIVFLGIELQQNNLIAKAQTRSEISRISVENTRMFQVPISLEITAKRRAGEELSVQERTWEAQAFRSEFKSWENVFYQYRVGLYDEPELEAYRSTWRNRFGRCEVPFIQSYSSVRMQLEPSFRGEMDSLLSQSNCD